MDLRYIQKSSKPLVDGCDGTDCGDGWCCNDSDYPICCPNTDDHTLWCGATADDCPSPTKKLHKMAANKRIQRSSKPLVDGCDGTDCGDGWCCNDSDYTVCCPDIVDDTRWCGATADDCPSTTKKLHKMAANKRIQRPSKPLGDGCGDGTECF